MDSTLRQRKQDASSSEAAETDTPSTPPKKTTKEPDHSFKFYRDEPTVFEYEQDFSIMSVFKAFLGLILLNFVLSYFVTGTLLWGSETKYTNPQYIKYVAMNPTTFGQRVYSEQELAFYDGGHKTTDTGLEIENIILLAVNGSVYDVSSNPRSYGPLGGYHFFAGRDAARAFVTGCFKTDLTHDLRGLDMDHANEVLEGWQRFFENSPKYWKVGTVVHGSLEGVPVPAPCESGAGQPKFQAPKPVVKRLNVDKPAHNPHNPHNHNAGGHHQQGGHHHDL